MINVKLQYYEWLMTKIDFIEKSKEEWYVILLDRLYTKEFYWLISNDDNRLQDGKELRITFSQETDIKKIDCLNRPCTVLEMLIGLMFRFDDIMPEPENSKEKKERPSKWFWEMIDNCGLTKYTDDYIMKSDTRINEVDEIIDRVLSREYAKDGTGGLFPLKDAEVDQRKVEIWYQMNAYVMEKCYTFET